MTDTEREDTLRKCAESEEKIILAREKMLKMVGTMNEKQLDAFGDLGFYLLECPDYLLLNASEETRRLVTTCASAHILEVYTAHMRKRAEEL